MIIAEDLVTKFIEYFVKNIVGFENEEAKYMSLPNKNDEFLLIAMDKVARLERKYGRLRNRVWSNCYFIFHDSKIDPASLYSKKAQIIKSEFPYLFIRSYVYFIYVDVSRTYQNSIFGDDFDVETSDFKIWLFNSKYEIQKISSRKGIFEITLDEEEKIDDYIYIANPESEIERLKSTNSDAIDCVRAFTSDLTLLEQTVSILTKLEDDLESDGNVRILLEGPARSGKTIIAASLLGKYSDSKFLLMNYFFYRAIVDGFHALSSWSKEEIDILVKNDELMLLIELKRMFPIALQRLLSNIKYARIERNQPNKVSKTKAWMIDNISLILQTLDKGRANYYDFELVYFLKSIHDFLVKTSDEKPFAEIDFTLLERVELIVSKIVNSEYNKLSNYIGIITDTIQIMIRHSRQRFFHHNINRSISSQVSDGCWIIRGNPTISRMWSNVYSPKLIICDEVQRLGLIPEYGTYDKFDEIEEILKNSKKTFFTGDNYQRLNYRYDKGIERINNSLSKSNEKLVRYNIPESVGVPAEVGLLMKYLAFPDLIKLDDLANNWKEERYFRITFIKNNKEKLVEMFDKDVSIKKHFASPMDSLWMTFGDVVSIETSRREKPIISLIDHEKSDFAYKYPYFCNEEIMPKFLLSAYELISRELDCLYIHIPKFKKDINNVWYKNHLYVLFTRPTSTLVINFEEDNEYIKYQNLIQKAVKFGAKIPVTYF